MKIIIVPIFTLFASYCFAQNVGIGNTTPLMRLHVSKPDSAVALLENTTTLNTNVSTGLYFKTGSGFYPFTGSIKTIGQSSSTARLGFFTFATNSLDNLKERLSITDDGKVGIGNVSPSAELDINGQIKISGGAPAAGRLLQSDANGLATWADKSANLLPAGSANNTLRYNGASWVSSANLSNTGVAIGIGTPTPAYLLDVNGRARLRYNGSTAGMWYNKADNTEAAFAGMFNDTIFGLFGTNGWSIGMDSKNGYLGLGVTTPSVPLSFNFDLGNKIALYGNSSGGHYGFGIQGSLLQMYSANNTSDIAFGHGNSANFTENMRIKGNGNVGIGVSPSFGKLDVREFTVNNQRAAYIGINNSLSGNEALRVESIGGTAGTAILAYRAGTGAAIIASSDNGIAVNVNGGGSPQDVGIKSNATTGVWGQAGGNGGFGVRASKNGIASGTALWADGYSFVSGNFDVIGTLSKSAGSFKIDHPQDPQNKFLIHSFVESPDMMNVYNGNIFTDNNGYATVRLPAYFEALNIDFKYQLTIVGKEFAQALVFEKIKNNQFTIRTDKPGIEVSWQITGVRNDEYAKQNRIVPEVEKPTMQKGKYLNPEVFKADKAMQLMPNEN